MPSALSLDLRSRMVSACGAGELTQTEIADLFPVHLKTVEKRWRHFRQTGSAHAKPHGGGVQARLAGARTGLTPLGGRTKRLHPGRVCRSLVGASSGWSPVCRCSRARSKPGVCREKKLLTAAEQQRPETERARRRFPAKRGRLPPRDLVFVEESGARTDRTRRYGRAPKGE